MSDLENLLYSWNGPSSAALAKVEIEDDSLRDGLQGAFVRRPSLSEKIELLELASRIGVHGAMLGFPGSSPQEFEDCRALVQAIEKRRLGLIPRFLARAHIPDLEPIVALHRESQNGVGADFFIGTSPLRRHVEKWDFAELLGTLNKAAEFMRRSQTPFSISIEDATRTPPRDLETVLSVALDNGATCIAICDTVGASTPAGAARIVQFALEVLDRKRSPIGILWHGHNDRGLALANSIAAAEAGARIIGGSFLGIGERTGNAALEQFIMYLHQSGVSGYRVDLIPEYCAKLARYTDTLLPDNAPLVGEQAFATCTGTHSAAILKARVLGIAYEDYVFSSVPASALGRFQNLQIGPTSGMANARYMLERLNLPCSEENAQRLLAVAKTKDRFLKTEEIVRMIRGDEDQA